MTLVIIIRWRGVWRLKSNSGWIICGSWIVRLGVVEPDYADVRVNRINFIH
jgi:hypothetical protein